MDKNEHRLVDTINNKFLAILPYLNEKTRRVWAATEANAIGYGGQRIVYKATKIAINTIKKGIQELKLKNITEENQVRKKGGGRKKKITQDPELKKDILNIVESSTRGDPETPLLWCSKSLRNITDSINQEEKRVSHQTVADILNKEGYSLMANRKTDEGSSSPDRDQQFNFIYSKTKRFQENNNPVISVDTKKKELIGNYKNNGREYHEKGKPDEVKVYDFIDKEKGKVAPYGIYDLSKNNGYVNVGISSDTAEFSVNSIRKWWYEMGIHTYPKSKEIYINADGGGSNGSRVRLWKTELQKLSNEINKIIHVSHFPPGTSKWNKIEHKMFCFISKNWRGRPLIDRATVVQLIAKTTTKKGLLIKSSLDENIYEKGIKVSDEDLANINLIKEKFHGEWNYKIAPQ